MLLKCECCGIEQDFVDSKVAFEAGWDAPPYFTQAISCHLCPAICCLGLDTHHKAHAYWELCGRPDDFNECCLSDSKFGANKEEYDKIIQKGKEFAESLIE